MGVQNYMMYHHHHSYIKSICIGEHVLAEQTRSTRSEPLKIWCSQVSTLWVNILFLPPEIKSKDPVSSSSLPAIVDTKWCPQTLKTSCLGFLKLTHL